MVMMAKIWLLVFCCLVSFSPLSAADLVVDFKKIHLLSIDVTYEKPVSLDKFPVSFREIHYSKSRKEIFRGQPFYVEEILIKTNGYSPAAAIQLVFKNGRLVYVKPKFGLKFNKKIFFERIKRELLGFRSDKRLLDFDKSNSRNCVVAFFKFDNARRIASLPYKAYSYQIRQEGEKISRLYLYWNLQKQREWVGVWDESGPRSVYWIDTAAVETAFERKAVIDSLFVSPINRREISGRRMTTVYLKKEDSGLEVKEEVITPLSMEELKRLWRESEKMFSIFQKIFK